MALQADDRYNAILNKISRYDMLQQCHIPRDSLTNKYRPQAAELKVAVTGGVTSKA